jgi:hypothetical protein
MTNDHCRHALPRDEALAAVDDRDGSIVGVIAVADDLQGRGIGSAPTDTVPGPDG